MVEFEKQMTQNGLSLTLNLSKKLLNSKGIDKGDWVKVSIEKSEEN